MRSEAVRRWARAVFTLDPRSLALFRVLLGALVLADLAQRAGEITAFLTDQGVLPRGAFRLDDWDFLWSFHTLGGGRTFEGLLLLVQALAALALLVGYRPRIAAGLCFVLIQSLQARNPLLRDGQDDLLRILLFWSMFLPIGARFAVRAERVPEGPRIGALAYLGQICVIYWGGAIGKLQSPWWTGDVAIERALQLSRYETSLGQWLLHFPNLLHALTPLVLIAEVGLPLLLFWPVRTERTRLIAVAGMIALHLAFGLCLRLGLFPWVSAVAWLALLPASFWDRVPAPVSADPLPAFCGWSLVPLGALMVVVAFNVLVLNHLQGLPRFVATVTDALGLQQYWVLFAPSAEEAPTLPDGWWVEPVVLANGEQIDLMAPDHKLTWKRPPVVSATFKNRRWRHYLANLRRDWPARSSQWSTVQESRENYTRWLCSDWNTSHPGTDRADTLALYFMQTPLGRPNDPPRRILLRQVVCPQ